MLVVAAFVLVLYSRPAGTVIMINRNRTYGKRDPIAARPGLARRVLNTEGQNAQPNEREIRPPTRLPYGPRYYVGTSTEIDKVWSNVNRDADGHLTRDARATWALTRLAPRNALVGGTGPGIAQRLLLYYLAVSPHGGESGRLASCRLRRAIRGHQDG